MALKLKIKCPECHSPLFTDEFALNHAWCLNEKCKLFIKRMAPYDLMFSYAGESFSNLIEEAS